MKHSSRGHSPIRILHVVGSLERGGGVQARLLDLLHCIDPDMLQMDVLVHGPVDAQFADEFRRRDSQVFQCKPHRHPLAFTRSVAQFLKERQEYDIVQAHHVLVKGWILRLAAKAGIPIRIAHAHNSISPSIETQLDSLRRAGHIASKRLVRRHATLGIAVSEQAATCTFGPAWKSDPRWHVIYSGVDFHPFSRKVESKQVRRELDIPTDTPVVGHVGRFSPQKNHDLIVEIISEAVRRRDRLHFLLVGDGPLQPQIRRQISNRGLDAQVTFAGVRDDVPRLMLGAMDAFVYPSRYEGLGMAIVEAQAAGLPCVCATAVPEDATFVPSLVKRVSLSEPARAWTAHLRDACRYERRLPHNKAVAAARASNFHIAKSVAKMEQMYFEQVQRSVGKKFAA